MDRSDSPSEIETAAVRLLAAREHSRKELLGKLAARGFARERIELVLNALAQQDLQSDARFTEQYIEGRVRKGNGPLRIRAELRERGIDEGQIEQGLEAYAEQWQDQLQRVLEQKYGETEAEDRKELARRARFLEYRGFPAELISKVLLRHE
jgi:regulatory protein